MSQIKKSTKVRITVLVILIAALVVFFFDFPIVYDRGVDFLNRKMGTDFPNFKVIPFRLGLDLQGGTQLVYEADTAKISDGDKTEAMEGVRDVIERRVNAFGVSEPVVQINKARDKWRILVELAGVKDVKEAIKMIGETPLLEFKEENNAPAREMTPAERKELEAFNKNAKEKAQKALKEALGGRNFSDVVKDYTESEIGQETGGDLGWIDKSSEYDYLYNKAEKVAAGKVYPQLIEWSDGYHIMNVMEKRESGTEVKANHILICYEGAKSCDQKTTKEDAKKKIDSLKQEASKTNFVKLSKANSTEPGAKEKGGDLGWFGKGAMVKPFEDAVFGMKKGDISDVVETEFGYHLIYKTDERPIIQFKIAQAFINTKTEADVLPPKDQWKNTGLTGSHLKTSRVEFAQQIGSPEVALEFNEEGKKLFADITTRNVGKPVAIYLDGKPISTPRVNEPIKEGKAVIQGDFDLNEAKLLAQRLNAGALPVPIKLVSQQTVGASLGQEYLQKSLFAGIVGLLFIGLFMIVYYRLPGLLATVALLIYGVLVLFIFKSIPVTLTLAGIAGFILSIGIAVDANVLIFERMKEELKLGKPLGTSIAEGFRRAWPSIRDGNVSTLITCLILAWFGTSVVKGFAITLAIGILCSMFSAIIITKQLMLMIIKGGENERKLWWFGVKKDNQQLN